MKKILFFPATDSAYTERYMGSPDSQSPFLPGHGNFDGYRASDLTRQAEKFAGRSLFLIHGTSDSNVHFQQSMDFFENNRVPYLKT